jgi:fructosamine-3-kinase
VRWRRSGALFHPRSHAAAPRRAPPGALANLYHVLNHANLFGGGYVAQAQRMIGELLAAA